MYSNCIILLCKVHLIPGSLSAARNQYVLPTILWVRIVLARWGFRDTFTFLLMGCVTRDSYVDDYQVFQVTCPSLKVEVAGLCET
jgi:hypothetical protein